MKKLFVLCASVMLVACLTTSCGKGCHCYLKTDVTHAMPVFEDESMSKDDCTAKEAQMNEEAGFPEFYKCK